MLFFINCPYTDILNSGVINLTNLMRGRSAVSVNFHPSIYVQLQVFGHNFHLPTAYIWHCSTWLKCCVTVVVCLLLACSSTRERVWTTIDRIVHWRFKFTTAHTFCVSTYRHLLHASAQGQSSLPWGRSHHCCWTFFALELQKYDWRLYVWDGGQHEVVLLCTGVSQNMTVCHTYKKEVKRNPFTKDTEKFGSKYSLTQHSIPSLSTWNDDAKQQHNLHPNGQILSGQKTSSRNWSVKVNGLLWVLMTARPRL